MARCLTNAHLLFVLHFVPGLIPVGCTLSTSLRGSVEASVPDRDAVGRHSLSLAVESWPLVTPFHLVHFRRTAESQDV